MPCSELKSNDSVRVSTTQFLRNHSRLNIKTHLTVMIKLFLVIWHPPSQATRISTTKVGSLGLRLDADAGITADERYKETFSSLHEPVPVLSHQSTLCRFGCCNMCYMTPIIGHNSFIVRAIPLALTLVTYPRVLISV